MEQIEANHSEYFKTISNIHNEQELADFMAQEIQIKIPLNTI